MKLKVLRLDFENHLVSYRVTTNTGEPIFGDFTTPFPESANTLPEIRAAILPIVRTVGASLRSEAQARANALANIETDPLP